eukprot:1334226-Rhodomonas_salina.2
MRMRRGRGQTQEQPPSVPRTLATQQTQQQQQHAGGGGGRGGAWVHQVLVGLVLLDLHLDLPP